MSTREGRHIASTLIEKTARDSETISFPVSEVIRQSILIIRGGSVIVSPIEENLAGSLYDEAGLMSAP